MEACVAPAGHAAVVRTPSLRAPGDRPHLPLPEQGPAPSAAALIFIEISAGRELPDMLAVDASCGVEVEVLRESPTRFFAFTLSVGAYDQNVSSINRNHVGVVWGELSLRKVVSHAQWASAIVTPPRVDLHRAGQRFSGQAGSTGSSLWR